MPITPVRVALAIILLLSIIGMQYASPMVFFSLLVIVTLYHYIPVWKQAITKQHPTTGSYQPGNPLMSAEAKHQYLQSPEWKALKQLKLKQSNHKCQLCNSTTNLHLHHLTYDRLGNELITDLILLCSQCHQLQHDHYGYDRLTDYSVLIKPKQSE